jgi:hypothetical protein
MWVFLLNLLFTCLISRKPNRSPSCRLGGRGAPAGSLVLVLEFEAWRKHFASFRRLGFAVWPFSFGENKK